MTKDQKIRCMRFCNKAFHPACTNKAFKAICEKVDENPAFAGLTWRQLANLTPYYTILPPRFEYAPLPH